MLTCHFAASQHPAQLFTAHWDHFPRALSFEDNILRTRTNAELNYDYHMKLLCVESDINMVKRYAVVYVYMEVTGLPGAARLEGLNCLQ